MNHYLPTCTPNKRVSQKVSLVHSNITSWISPLDTFDPQRNGGNYNKCDHPVQEGAKCVHMCVYTYTTRMRNINGYRTSLTETKFLCLSSRLRKERECFFLCYVLASSKVCFQIFLNIYRMSSLQPVPKMKTVVNQTTQTKFNLVMKVP